MNEDMKLVSMREEDAEEAKKTSPVRGHIWITIKDYGDMVIK